ncbi:MAG: ABC transporter ATP-binding protein [Armatimonadota bacterium]
MWKATLPDGVDPGEPVRLCVEADLHPDGSFGREWLVITETALLVVTEQTTGAEVRRRLVLSELTEPKIENLVGGGVLEIGQNGDRFELIRFSGSRAPRFAATAHLLEKWLKNEEEAIPEEEDKHCPRCNLPLEVGTKVCPACLPKSRALLRLMGYLMPYWGVALSLSLLSILITGLALVPPYLQKPLMDKVLVPAGKVGNLTERGHLLVMLTLVMVSMRVLSSAGGALQNWLSAWLGNKITHDIRCRLYEHLQYLSLRFFDKRQMGSVVSRVNQDTGQLQQFLVWASQDIANNLLLFVGIGVLLFVLNWQLALVVFLPAPFIAILSAAIWRRVRYYMVRYFRRWGRINAVLNETLTGLRVIKAFAQESREIKRFNEQSYEVASAGIHAERVWSITFSGFSLLLMAGSMVVWFLGAQQVLGSNMTLGSFSAFVFLVDMFYRPVQALSFLMNFSSRSLTAAERIFEVLDCESEIKEAEQSVSIPRIEGRVEYRDVTFGYERHRLVLKNVSFEVEPGEMIGLVGHSGAGKSTTMNLLCRFYDVLGGAILIDGVPINQLHLEDLRRQIGLVPQNIFLFSGTIAENIAYARPNADRADIIRAAKVANAHEFIRGKPDGYETLIGEGGKGLSGGEQQRIAIARAVLHDPRILILDEATSHVDVETEKQIQEAIARLVKGRTTFAIAHRLSTLKNANRLLVLKQGEIAEIGTHDELLSKEEGEFARLVKTYQEISNVAVVAR